MTPDQIKYYYERLVYAAGGNEFLVRQALAMKFSDYSQLEAFVVQTTLAHRICTAITITWIRAAT